MADYRVRNADYVPVKVTKEEFISLIGTNQTAPYALAVWSEKMTIDAVPEGLRNRVQAIVNNRLEWCGSHENFPVSNSELLQFVRSLED